MTKNKSKLYNISDEDFIKIVKESQSLTNCIFKCGLSIYGSHGRKVVKRRCEELNLDISHWDKKNYFNNCSFKEKTNEEIFIKDSKSNSKIRDRILRDNLIEYKCAICGNRGEYNGKPLVLHLDHENGDHTDNRLTNLRFLCPNCHSQTETFGSKSAKVTNANKFVINGEEKTSIEIGKEYNLSPDLINSFFLKYPRETVLEFLEARKNNLSLNLKRPGQSWLEVYGIENPLKKKSLKTLDKLKNI